MSLAKCQQSGVPIFATQPGFTFVARARSMALIGAFTDDWHEPHAPIYIDAPLTSLASASRPTPAGVDPRSNTWTQSPVSVAPLPPLVSGPFVVSYTTDVARTRWLLSYGSIADAPGSNVGSPHVPPAGHGSISV